MPQSQESLVDQLNKLIVLAEKEGLYDAADWIKGNLMTVELRSTLFKREADKFKHGLD
jgi:hypothetical protein